MFTLLLTAIIATGISQGTASVRIEHQVVGTDWETRELCEDAARYIVESHTAAYNEIKSMQSHPRHAGPYIRTKCVWNNKH